MSFVLLVEDSSTEIDIISRCLREAGIQVVTATSSEEAQEKLRYNRPDLILLDIVLPGRSGFELCRQIKANQSTDTIPVVLCSTKNTNADHVWGSMLGADAYLSKPIDRDTLLQTIQKFLKV